MPYSAIDSQWPRARHPLSGEGRLVVLVASLVPVSGGGADGLFGSGGLDGGQQG
jgi:hypothetical protein